MLLRRLKPLQAKAISAASGIISKDKATDADVLRAAAFINKVYIELLKEVYQDDEGSGEKVEGGDEITKVSWSVVSSND